jgi:hypothetical protein
MGDRLNSSARVVQLRRGSSLDAGDFMHTARQNFSAAFRDLTEISYRQLLKKERKPIFQAKYYKSPIHHASRSRTIIERTDIYPSGH